MTSTTSEASEPPPRADGMSGLAKGIAVLEAFGIAREALTISDVARLTELSKPAARRCLLTLTELGYLRFDGRRYEPTRRMTRLGAAYLDADPLNVLAQRFLDELRDRLQETVALIVWDEGETVITARADPNRLLAMRGTIGRRMPAHCTASGRVLMAALPDEHLLSELHAHPPRAYTEHTVVDEAKVLQAVAAARREGHALVDGEIEIGLLSVAVPVVNVSGETIAALAVYCNSVRVTHEEALESFLPSLHDIAEGIGRVA